MLKKIILIGVGIVLLIGLGVRARQSKGAEPAQPYAETKGSVAHSAREPFIGVWRAVSISDTRSDGTEVPDLYLGAHPVGLVIYDVSGYMCAGSMNPDRAKWANPSKATREDLALAAEGYDTYCGTFDVDEKNQSIVHHVQVGVYPKNLVAFDF